MTGISCDGRVFPIEVNAIGIKYSLSSLTDAANSFLPSRVANTGEQVAHSPHPPSEEMILSGGYFSLNETNFRMQAVSAALRICNLFPCRWPKEKIRWVSRPMGKLSAGLQGRRNRQ